MTSFRQGMEGTAPGRETAMEEALALIFSAWGMSMPSAKPARKKPVKVSPAAVVSTAFTGKMGWKTCWSPSA